MTEKSYAERADGATAFDPERQFDADIDKRLENNERYREAKARVECKRRGIDPDALCADGGIEAWMVVDQELTSRARNNALAGRSIG